MGLGFWAYGFNSVFLLFFLKAYQKEDGMRRKHENDAFKVAPTKTSSLTYFTPKNPLRKQK